jgi:hypothetical protein
MEDEETYWLKGDNTPSKVKKFPHVFRMAGSRLFCIREYIVYRIRKYCTVCCLGSRFYIIDINIKYRNNIGMNSGAISKLT